MTTDPADPVPADPAPDDDAQNWSKATDEVRAVAKWAIGGLAAVATVIFGAGPIVTRPSSRGAKDASQLVIAGIAGIVGLGAIICLIMLVAGMLVPQRISLHALPRRLTTEIDQRQELVADDRRPSDDVRRVPREPVRLHECPGRGKAPPGTGQAPDRQAATGTHLAELVELREAAGCPGGRSAVVEADAAIYRSAANRILEIARFEGAPSRFARARSPMYALTGAAAVGALVFQLALSDAPDEEDAAETSESAAGDTGYLLEAAADTPGALLWAQLGLDACASGPAGQRQVPVIVGSGAGITDDPYEVTTLRVGDSASTCEIQRFRVLPDVLTLQLPEAESITIEYTPAPTPSPTPGCDRVVGVPVGCDPDN